MLSHNHFHNILRLFDVLNLKTYKTYRKFLKACVRVLLRLIHKKTAVIFHLQVFFNDFAKF